MQEVIVTPLQIKSVKSLGFLHNRATNKFSGRIVTGNGTLTAEQMAVLSQAAKIYGNGIVTFTVRLTVEVQGIEYENIEAFKEFISRGAMVTGGTGAKVRPVVACKGSTCVFGLCDTHDIGNQIHSRFFEGYADVVLPHKFKIAVGGCPNSCAKPDLNDIGIVGQRVPKLDIDKCKGCKKCAIEAVCPMSAASVVNAKVHIDKAVCNNCSRCSGKCPFKIHLQQEDLFAVYIGGRWGKKHRTGTALGKLFTLNDALNVIEKSILLFKSYGIKGERFSDTIERIGVDNAERILLSNELLQNKQQIIAAEVKQVTT